MKWVNNNEVLSKKDCLALLYEIVNQMAGDTLTVEGKNVKLPGDKDLISKVKFEEDPGKTKFSIKIQWVNDIPFPEVTEENEDDSEDAEETPK